MSIMCARCKRAGVCVLEESEGPYVLGRRRVCGIIYEVPTEPCTWQSRRSGTEEEAAVFTFDLLFHLEARSDLEDQ